jgi:hypothetical protein
MTGSKIWRTVRREYLQRKPNPFREHLSFLSIHNFAFLAQSASEQLGRIQGGAKWLAVFGGW